MDKHFKQSPRASRENDAQRAKQLAALRARIELLQAQLNVPHKLQGIQQRLSATTADYFELRSLGHTQHKLSLLLSDWASRNLNPDEEAGLQFSPTEICETVFEVTQIMALLGGLFQVNAQRNEQIEIKQIIDTLLANYSKTKHTKNK